MARILVAASPEPRAIVERILAGHELVCAETLAQAEHALRQKTFDLIFCTVVFDESRMFDLLRLAKSSPGLRQIPFVCARILSHIIRLRATVEAVAFTCQELGADAFLDIAAYEADPERAIRDGIEKLLQPPSPQHA